MHFPWYNETFILPLAVLSSTLLLLVVGSNLLTAILKPSDLIASDPTVCIKICHWSTKLWTTPKGLPKRIPKVKKYALYTCIRRQEEAGVAIVISLISNLVPQLGPDGEWFWTSGWDGYLTKSSGTGTGRVVRKIWNLNHRSVTSFLSLTSTLSLLWIWQKKWLGHTLNCSCPL